MHATTTTDNELQEIGELQPAVTGVATDGWWRYIQWRLPTASCDLVPDRLEPAVSVAATRCPTCWTQCLAMLEPVSDSAAMGASVPATNDQAGQRASCSATINDADSCNLGATKLDAGGCCDAAPLHEQFRKIISVHQF